MTKEQTRDAAAVMLGWADGKEVQKKRRGTVEWEESDPIWDWASYTYRLKPAVTLRPWTADEVPLGAWMKYKHQDCRCLIVDACDPKTRTRWFHQCEHSTDGGKTWKPCGVEEAKP